MSYASVKTELPPVFDVVVELLEGGTRAIRDVTTFTRVESPSKGNSLVFRTEDRVVVVQDAAHSSLHIYPAGHVKLGYPREFVGKKAHVTFVENGRTTVTPIVVYKEAA